MSPTKKRQTMGKITRERELKERRALKQEKKDARKAAAAEELANPHAETDADALAEHAVDGEPDPRSS